MQGEPIASDVQHMYGATHFSRVIGHEVRGVYDGTLFWSCPDCGKAWPRAFSRGVGLDRMTTVAADYALLHNSRAADTT